MAAPKRKSARRGLTWISSAQERGKVNVAVTKILARKGGLNDAIRYVVNGDKTNGQTLTAYLNCDPGHAARRCKTQRRASTRRTASNITT